MGYSGLLMCAAALFGCVSVTSAQTQQARTGLLIVAHGAGPEWNDGVRATVAQVRWEQGPIATAFLMGEEAALHSWDSAVVRLVREGSLSIVVVPLMVSSHGSHYRQVQHYAGLPTELPAELGDHGHHAIAPPVPMLVTPALDASPELGLALAERWAQIGAADRARPVLLVAHGPNSDQDAALWIRALLGFEQLFAAAGLRADYRVGLLRDDAPAPVRAAAVQAMRDTLVAVARRSADSVVVIPVMISTSSITRVRIPADLAATPMRYSSMPLTPLPPIARWIERMAAEALGVRDRGIGGSTYR